MATHLPRSLRRPSRLSACLLLLLGGACDRLEDAAGGSADEAPEGPAKEAPKRVELTPQEAKTRLEVDGANLEMGETEVNGLRLSKLRCAGVARPLLGGMAIIGALAEQKSALDACVPGGDAAIATWTSESGALTELTVAGASTAGADACIKAALATVTSPFATTCAAVVLVGETAGADAAAARMLGE